MRMMDVNVSLPADLVGAVMRRAEAGGFSQYVFGAVQERLYQDLLAELLWELAAYGPIPPDIRAPFGKHEAPATASAGADSAGRVIPLPDESAWAEMTARVTGLAAGAHHGVR
jgi:hypothetical protein